MRFVERGHSLPKTVGTLKSSDYAKSNLGIAALRTASSTTCLLFFLALSSCVSLSERVVDLTKGSYFAQALLAIQKEELRVQEAPDKKSLDELAKAKSAFAEAVEGEFLPRISAEISEGKTYTAHKIATDGLGLCAWSNHLVEIDSTLTHTILAIEAVESSWASILQSGVVPTDQKGVTSRKGDPTQNRPMPPHGLQRLFVGFRTGHLVDRSSCRDSDLPLRV